MKKLVFPLLFAALAFSCGESSTSETAEAGNLLENLTITVDTVVVDPGEEIINLAQGLYLSDLAADHQTLYLFDDQDHTLSVIDLDGLQLKEKLPFEKEGPNGVGDYISDIQARENGNFLFTNYLRSGLFNRSGEKIMDFNFTPKDIQGIESDMESPMTRNVVLSEDGKTHYSLPTDFYSGSQKFAIVDPSAKTGRMLDIPAMDKAADFRIILTSGQSMMISLEETDLKKIGNSLFITSSFTSKAYRFDLEKDSLQLFEFPHQLTAIERVGEIKNEVSSQEEFDAERAKLSSQILYKPFIWDDKSKRFYRFSQIQLPKVDKELPNKYEVFLHAYDENLQLIGEKKLDELDATPSYPFFKDGKLWSYVNVEDELGFAVFTFDF